MASLQGITASQFEFLIDRFQHLFVSIGMFILTVNLRLNTRFGPDTPTQNPETVPIFFVGLAKMLVNVRLVKNSFSREELDKHLLYLIYYSMSRFN